MGKSSHCPKKNYEQSSKGLENLEAKYKEMRGVIQNFCIVVYAGENKHILNITHLFLLIIPWNNVSTLHTFFSLTLLIFSVDHLLEMQNLGYIKGV